MRGAANPGTNADRSVGGAALPNPDHHAPFIAGNALSGVNGSHSNRAANPVSYGDNRGFSR